MTPLVDHLVKLLNMFSSDYDGEVANAARMAHAKLVASGSSWTELLANGSASALTSEQMQKIYVTAFVKGEAEGYRRGMLDAQSGAVRGPRAAIGDDLDWARTVLEAAEPGKA